MAVNVGSAIGYLDLDTSGFNRGFSSAMSDLKVFQAQGATTQQKLKGLSSAMGSVGSTLTKNVTLPIVGVGAAIVKVSSDFQKKMSNVQAISQATGEDFKELKELAIDLGASTAFSSGEVADAMTEMAKAGWSTQQILDGMGGVLDAAAASGEGLATTTTIVADAITGFGLEASDSAKIADLLTQAANAGTIGITDLGETFKYISPVANAMGMSVEDVTTAVSAMSMAGIKGSQAGTSLRTMLTNLVKPTDAMAKAMEDLGIEVENKDGSFKSLDEIVANLRGSFSGLTEKEKTYYAATLAGKEGMSGMLALLNLTEEEYNAIADSMDNAGGVAKSTAEIMQDNLQSKVEQLGGAFESLAIKLGDMIIPMLQDLVVNITNVVDKFTNLDESTQKTILKIAGIAAIIGPVLLISSKIIGMISSIGTAFSGLSSIAASISAAGGLGAALSGIVAAAAPVLGVIAGVVAAVIALKAAWDTNFAGIRDFTAEMVETVKSIISGLKDIFVSIVEGIKEAWESNFLGIQDAVKFVLDQVKIYLTGMFEFWSNIFKAIDALVHGDFSGAMDFLKKAIKGAVDGVKTVLKNLFEAFGDIFKNILSAVKSKMTDIASNMKEGASKAVKGFLQFLNDLPGKVGEIIGFVLGKVVKFVIEFPAKAKEAATNFFNNVINGIKNLPANIKEKFDNVVEKAKSFGKDFKNKAKEAATNFGTNLKDGLSELPGKMKEIGGNIVSGIWEGVTSAGSWLKDKISDFAGGIVSGFKDALGIHSPSKVAENEVGKNIALGVAEGITKNASKAKNAAKDLSSQIVAAAKVKVATLKESNKLSVAEEVSFWKTIISQTKAGTKARLDAEKEYAKAKKVLAAEEETIAQEALTKAEKRLETRKVYNQVSLKDEMDYWDKIRKQTKEGTDARIEADKKYFESKKAYTEQLASLEEQYRQNQAAVNEQLKADIESLTQAYTDAVESRTNSILGSFNLFTEYTTKVETDSQTLIAALQSQVNALSDWGQQLATLEGRHILPEDLVTEIENMGVDASGQIEALNTMTDEELEKYVLLWQEKNKLAREKAIKELEPMAKETSAKIQELNTTANTKLKELKATYKSNLEALGVTAKAAAKKAGNDTVSGIIEGLDSKRGELSSTLESLASMVSSKIAAINASIASAQTAANSLTTKGLTSVNGKSHRNGLDYVPYDGYVAELHEGERVLTKQENSNSSGSSGNVYNFYGTQPLDEKETARQFKKSQQQLALNV